jgi:hypothetical protein
MVLCMIGYGDLAGQASPDSEKAATDHFDRYARLLIRGIDREITLTLRTESAIDINLI